MNEYTRNLIFELLNDYKNDLKNLIRYDMVNNNEIDMKADQEQLKKVVRITEYLYKNI